MIKKALKNNKKITVLFVLITLFLTGLTIGFSMLSSTLTITGKSTIKKNSWTIYFDDIEISEDSVKNENPSDDATLSVNGVADPTKQNIEFTAKLDKPGDIYEFTVYTVNDGSIDAEIESIEKFELTNAQKEYLDFEVGYYYADNLPLGEIKECDILKAGERKLIKIIVKFKKLEDVTKYPSQGVNLDMFFRINYSQNVTCIGTPINNDTKYHFLTIRPNGGVFEGRRSITRLSIEEGEERDLINPRRTLYEFDGWEVLLPGESEEKTFTLIQDINDLSKYVFTMGEEDVTIQAKWKDGDFVARIEDHYFTSIQEAFDEVKNNNQAYQDNTVHLLRDTTEEATNTTSNKFTFDLEGFTVSGRIVNDPVGKLTLVNGTILSGLGHDEAVLNRGNLTLGIDDGTVEVDNSITIKGVNYGLVNEAGSKFNFYDGYIESVNAISGIISNLQTGDVTIPQNYFVYVDNRMDAGVTYQKVYLTPTPNRAVAKTTEVIDAYYYDLQEAINTVVEAKNKLSGTLESNDNRYVIYATRTFEAAYPISVPSNSRVFFDMNGYSIQTGEPVTNNGYFKIYNSKESNSIISLSKTFTNNSNLEINDVDVKITNDYDAIVNKGNLKLVDSTVNSTKGYCVKNIENGTLDFNENVVLRSIHVKGSANEPDIVDNYALYNSGNKATINGGLIYGLNNAGTITIDGDSARFIPYRNNIIYGTSSYYNKAIYNSGNITMNNGIISNSIDTEGAISNTGTFTFNGGTLNGEYLVVRNSGTFNVKGSEVTSTRTAIEGGTIIVDGGNVKSTTSSAINNYSSTYVTIKNGEVSTENGIAIQAYSVNVQGGFF